MAALLGGSQGQVRVWQEGNGLGGGRGGQAFDKRDIKDGWWTSLYGTSNL